MAAAAAAALLPGFGGQRNLELLVEVGFTPDEAIHIATANGAHRRTRTVSKRQILKRHQNGGSYEDPLHPTELEVTN